MLTDNPWNGGGGYSYEEVGRMTPDQVYHRVVDRDLLKSKEGRRVTRAVPGGVQPDADGLIKGRAEDGTPIQGRVRGKSLARQLMEEEQAKQEAERAKGKKRRGRRST